MKRTDMRITNIPLPKNATCVVHGNGSAGTVGTSPLQEAAPKKRSAKAKAPRRELSPSELALTGMPVIGAKVRHAAFGVGEVVGHRLLNCTVDGVRSPDLDPRLIVQFEVGGEKELLWAFCHGKLKRVRDYGPDKKLPVSAPLTPSDMPRPIIAWNTEPKPFIWVTWADGSRITVHQPTDQDNAESRARDLINSYPYTAPTTPQARAVIPGLTIVRSTSKHGRDRYLAEFLGISVNAVRNYVAATNR